MVEGCWEGSSPHEQNEKTFLRCKCDWWEGWFRAKFLSKLSVIKKANFNNYITKTNVMTSLFGVPNVRRWTAFGMHIWSRPNLTVHINWSILSKWTCKWYIVMNIKTNKVLSIARPLEVFTVIHDKMDPAKTSSPCFSHQIKAIDGLLTLLITVTCMVLSNVLQQVFFV